MTRMEYITSCRYKENFWLYVVEQVESDEYKISCINNPAEKIDIYLFDHGWKGISEDK